MAAPVALRGLTVHVSARLGAGSRAVAAPRACVRARAGASTLAAPALAGRVALRGVALPTLQARKPASGRAVAVSPVALFKQGKDSIQWLNVLCTIAACAAFIVPLVRAEASALYAAPTTRRTAAPRAAFTISRLRSAAARCLRCPHAASGPHRRPCASEAALTRLVRVSGAAASAVPGHAVGRHPGRRGRRAAVRGGP